MKKLDDDIFKCIVKNTPLISVDLILKKDNKFLLGKRKNKPAKDYYFTMGGRIFKNESIKEAQIRIAKEELNIDLEIEPVFLGVFEHFYKNSFLGNEIFTHYVNLGYLLDYDIIANKKYIDDIKKTDMPFEQHSEYIWLTKSEILSNDKVHQYVKDYFKRI
jgi:colanic acid biosynthesis protein WcaH